MIVTMPNEPKPNHARPDELRAILKESAKRGDLPTLYRRYAETLRLMVQLPTDAAIRGQAMALARRFDDLAEQAERDMIPIRRNPGAD